MSKNVAGWVASGHVETTRVAMEVLEAGGNAFDAVVAATFASTVSEPLLSSLGGGGFLMAKTFDQDPVLYDFFVDFPGDGNHSPWPAMDEIHVDFGSAQQDFHVGPASIAVPGALLGLVNAQQELGKMPLNEVLAPATDLASKGVKVNPTQAYVFQLLHPILSNSHEAKKLFFYDKKLLGLDDLYKNTNLGNFLKNLTLEWIEDFYRGDLNRELFESLKGRSLLTKKNLNQYKVIKRKADLTKYRNWQLFSNPLPSLGGLLVNQLLESVQEYALNEMAWGSQEHLKVFAQNMKSLEDQKTKGMDYLGNSKKGTTHISVGDRFGNCASLSISNGEGSGEYIPGTGIMLNNMLGEEDLMGKPSSSLPVGERMASMMAPSLLVGKEKTYILGSGGSKRIRSSLMQVICNIVDFDLSLSEAIERPRMNWDGKFLQIEPGFESQAVSALKDIMPINIWPEKDFYFGGTHIVEVKSEGLGDSRRGGVGATAFKIT